MQLITSCHAPMMHIHHRLRSSFRPPCVDLAILPSSSGPSLLCSLARSVEFMSPCGSTPVLPSSTGGIITEMSITRRGVSVRSVKRACAFFLLAIVHAYVGNVTYLNQAEAVSSGLTYINSAQNAIIKVDNTTTIAPAPLVHRNSVRYYPRYSRYPPTWILHRYD